MDIIQGTRTSGKTTCLVNAAENYLHENKDDFAYIVTTAYEEFYGSLSSRIKFIRPREFAVKYEDLINSWGEGDVVFFIDEVDKVLEEYFSVKGITMTIKD